MWSDWNWFVFVKKTLVRVMGEITGNGPVWICWKGVRFLTAEDTQVKQTNKKTYKNKYPKGLSKWSCQNCSGGFSPTTCRSTYLRSTESKGRVHGARGKFNLDLQIRNNNFYYIFYDFLLTNKTKCDIPLIKGTLQPFEDVVQRLPGFVLLIFSA